MQVIITRHHGQTDKKPARVSATSTSGLRVMISVPMEAQTTDDKHRAAVVALRERKGITSGPMIAGDMPDGSMVWVFVDDKSPYIA